MSLIGRLQSYDEDERLCFLEVEVTAAKECVIFISGLRGNFLTPNYLVELSKYFTDRGIAFVQIQLRSHPHFGLYTLNDDCDDMEKLIALLKHKYSKFILFGHSTGCQDIVHFLKTKEYSLISRCFLQGPVSDREYMEKLNNQLPDLIKIAQSLNKNEFLPLSVSNDPITAYRYLSLYSVGGDDDYFSSDLEDNFYLSYNQKCQIYFLISECDKYQVAQLETLKYKFGLVKNSEVFIIKNGDHGLTTPETFCELIKCLNSVLKNLI